VIGVGLGYGHDTTGPDDVLRVDVGGGLCTGEDE